MEILRSLLDSPIDALKTAAQAVDKAHTDLQDGTISETEYLDLVKTACDLEAIDAAMYRMEQKQALQDGLKALLAIAQSVAG